MAGVILLVAWHLIDFTSIRRIISTDRSEAAVILLTFLATLFVQLEFAIYSGKKQTNNVAAKNDSVEA